MNVTSVDDIFELQPPGSEAIVEARLALLGAAVDGPQLVGRFTDEELVALDGLESAPLAPSPWYSSLSDAGSRSRSRRLCAA